MGTRADCGPRRTEPTAGGKVLTTVGLAGSATDVRGGEALRGSRSAYAESVEMHRQRVISSDPASTARGVSPGTRPDWPEFSGLGAGVRDRTSWHGRCYSVGIRRIQTGPSVPPMSVCPVVPEELEEAVPEAVFEQLESSPQGLSSDQARQRLEQFGPNALGEKMVSPLRVFLGYFWGRSRGLSR